MKKKLILAAMTLLLVAVVFLLAYCLGCHKTVTHKTVTYIDANGGALTQIKKGNVLEWQLVPSKYKSFDVCFEAPDPCGDNHDPIHGSLGNPAHCTVVVDATQTPHPYIYNVILHISPQADPKVCKDLPLNPSLVPMGSAAAMDKIIRCPQCPGVGGDTGSDDESDQKHEVPGGKGPGRTPDVPVRALTQINYPYIPMTCGDDGKTLTLPSFWETPPATQNELGITWVPDKTATSWTVTFDKSSPCDPNSPIGPKSDIWCYIDANPKLGSYSYTATETINGTTCSNGGSGEVTICDPAIAAGNPGSCPASSVASPKPSSE
jgi:hypothetical protein